MAISKNEMYELAKKGNSAAQYNCGLDCLEAEMFSKAIEHFYNAAEQNNAYALFALGVFCELGRSDFSEIDEDERKNIAKGFFEIACNYGHPDAAKAFNNGSGFNTLSAFERTTNFLDINYTPQKLSSSTGTTAQPPKPSTPPPVAKPMPAPVAPSAKPAPAPVQVYKIGDKGPAGGIVFYDKGNNSDGWRYMEAALANQETKLAWASSGFTDTDISGIETIIGTGKANTAAILAVDVNAPAAKACTDYRGGGKNDWFLPGKDELNELYKQRNLFGITSGYFWSSSWLTSKLAWRQYFGDGEQETHFKSNTHFVRAVRYF